MTQDPLVFEELQLLRAPGFETDGFVVEDLCGGINVVYGPNAAGKSTLARCVQWLCWPETADERASLVGSLSLNSDRWRVEVDRGRASHQRDGKEANAPPLPPSDQRDRYLLSLHELLQRETADASFAEIIERETAGGYDLADAHDALGFSDTPSSANRSVVRDAKAAIEDVRDARNEAAELRQEQTELAQLRRDLETARDARERAELLRQAIDYGAARDDHEQAVERLDEFPDILAEVDGDEFERVQALDADIEDWAAKQEEAEDAKAAAEAELADVALPEEGVSDGELDRLKGLRDTLADAETRKREREVELADARGERRTAREDIPLDVETADLEALEPVTWKTVSAFARRSAEHQAEREVRNAVDQLLGDESQQGPDMQALTRASQSLEEWLAASGTASTAESATAFRVAVVSALLLVVTPFVLGALANPISYVIMLLAAGILLYGVWKRGQGSDGGDARQSHRERFDQTDVAAPESWTVDDVRARLLALYAEIGDRKVAEQRREWRDALATDRDSLERTEHELDETRADLRERLGAAPDATDVELTIITKRVLDWQAAHDDVEGARDAIDAADDQIEAACANLTEALAAYGADEIATSSDATSAIRELENRERRRQNARDNLDRATTTIEEAAEKLDELREERDAIFADLGLETDEDETLRTRCTQVAEYRPAEEAANEARIRADTEATKLEGYPGFEPELKERAVADLRSDLRDAERTAEGFDDLQSSIAAIEEKIRQAKNADQIETALADRDRALDDLEELYEDDRAAVVGDVLVDHVTEATMDSSRPAVFERARELLATITRGRYRLVLDETETSFRAYDEANQKGLSLDELSSGTRVQLLLAVRLAFVEHQEHGVKLPLLMDETLANTDDRRAQIIIESTIELARDGRQVFYFTAQGDEVAKWAAALESVDGIEYREVDLASVRNIQDGVQVPDLGSIEVRTPDPPSPDEHDDESYGEALDVEPFDPHRGTGSAHLWYVVDDVETLHQLLDLGIVRWGQLENLLDNGRAELLVDDADQLARTRIAAEALDEFVDAWNVGRGKPVDRDVLDASGAVSRHFIDDVSELAESVGGDGQRIVDALIDGQVDRFRRNKARELETYLSDNGYISSRESLDDGQIRARVTGRVITEGVEREEARNLAQELLARLRTPPQQR